MQELFDPLFYLLSFSVGGLLTNTQCNFISYFVCVCFSNPLSLLSLFTRAYSDLKKVLTLTLQSSYFFQSHWRWLIQLLSWTSTTFSCPTEVRKLEMTAELVHWAMSSSYTQIHEPQTGLSCPVRCQFWAFWQHTSTSSRYGVHVTWGTGNLLHWKDSSSHTTLWWSSYPHTFSSKEAA